MALGPRFLMAPRPRIPEQVMLRRKSPLPVWIQIGWRVGLVLGLLGFAVLVHWIERDGLRDNYDGQVSFLDVIYFTMISITTTGYGDVVPVTDTTRMFDALIVTPIRIFFVLIFSEGARWRAVSVMRMEVSSLPAATTRALARAIWMAWSVLSRVPSPCRIAQPSASAFSSVSASQSTTTMCAAGVPRAISSSTVSAPQVP